MRVQSLILTLLSLPTLGLAQAVPTASTPIPYSGLNLPAVTGNLQYGLTASQVIEKGYSKNGGVYGSTGVSGDLSYGSKSELYPFHAIYAGGLQIGDGSGSDTYFQSLALSQGYVTRSWVFGISDVVSYLPQSPTVGLSGVPGTGDIGLDPIQVGNEPSQSIITINNARVSNSVSGTVARSLGAFTSASAGASYGILAFTGRSGLDSTEYSADVALSRRIDARSAASLSATYGTYRYSLAGHDLSFVTRGLSAGYHRQLTRSLNTSISGGPEWISGSTLLAIPSRLTYSAGAGLNYVVQVYNIGVSYSRTISGGAGVQPGGISNSLIASVERSFRPSWSASANLGYSKTEGLSTGQTPVNVSLLGLTTTGNYNSFYAGVQLSRRLSRSLSAYGSYTAIDQSYSRPDISPVALNGIVQSFAVGISYFPRSLHLGQL